jgi:hypothetical protein
MHIDWKSLGVVAAVSIVASVAIVAIVSLGIAALGAADTKTQHGGYATAARIAGWACITAAATIVLYGLWLIIPQFH